MRSAISACARVSKTDGPQSPDLPRGVLETSGVDEVDVYCDLASGVRDDAAGLDSCRRAVREGDVLIVWKLDALGRNLARLVDTVGTWRPAARSCRCSPATGRRVDTSTAADRLVFDIFATLAEFE